MLKKKKGNTTKCTSKRHNYESDQDLFFAFLERASPALLVLSPYREINVLTAV